MSGTARVLSAALVAGILANGAAALALPNLSIVKNPINPTADLNDEWTWSLSVSNAPGADPAVFSDTQRILHDDLPPGPTYLPPEVASSVGVTNVGNVACVLVANAIDCRVNGADVSIAALGRLTVVVRGSFGAEASFTNPDAAGSCAVDPDGVVAEDSDADNDCNESTAYVARRLVGTKSFSPAVVSRGENVSILALTITNPNAVTTAMMVTMRDVLPEGMRLGPGAPLANSCNAAFVQGMSTDSIEVNGIDLGPGASCQIQIPVTVLRPGTYVNEVTEVPDAFNAPPALAPITATLIVTTPAPVLGGGGWAVAVVGLLAIGGAAIRRRRST